MEKKCLGVAENATEEERIKFLDFLKNAGKVVVAGVAGAIVDGPLGAGIAAAAQIAENCLDNAKTAEMGA